MRDADEDSDEALMIAYSQGNSAAFERLYRRHRGGLYRYLLRHTSRVSVAEELFQDVWMNLIRARSAYTPQARFATYLYRIAHNRLVDHYRRGNHVAALPGREEGDPDPVELLPADPANEPGILYERKASVERLVELLAALPLPQREAFVMHEEGGLSVEEIAEATGVNRETAKSRLRYAMAKLRQGLRDWL